MSEMWSYNSRPLLPDSSQWGEQTFMGRAKHNVAPTTSWLPQGGRVSGARIWEPWIDFFLLKNAEYNSMTYLQLKSSLASRWKVISGDYLNFLSVQQNISGQSSQWIEATDRHLSGSLAKSPLRRGDGTRPFSFIYT